MSTVMCEGSGSSAPNSKVVAGTVVGNRRLCRQHFRLDVELARFGSASPGQFVQLRCSEPPEQQPLPQHDWPDGTLPRLVGAELSDRVALLRRPFSIAGLHHDPQAGRSLIGIIYHVVGPGSKWMEQLSPGHCVSLLGPLGNGFWLYPDQPTAILIGGGIGLAPLVWLAEALKAAGKNVVALCGAQSADLLPLTPVEHHKDRDDPLLPTLGYREFADHGVPVVVATDDGSAGFGGFVSQALEQYWRHNALDPRAAAVYACGPEPMLKAVADFCMAEGLVLQVCVERLMACGTGCCQSCAVRLRDTQADQGWSYRLACTDGPVFDAAQIDW